VATTVPEGKERTLPGGARRGNYHLPTHAGVLVRVLLRALQCHSQQRGDTRERLQEKICANKQYHSIDYQAERFIEYFLNLSPEEALRKAGILSGRFWLFR
jgi:hypothetical protein